LGRVLGRPQAPADLVVPRFHSGVDVISLLERDKRFGVG